MKGIFKNNFQGRNGFIPNDYYLRAYRRLNVGRRSRTFAAWREALALSTLTGVYSHYRELCALWWSGEWLVLFKERAAPFGAGGQFLSCRHVRAFVHSLGVTWWTLRSIPTDSIL